MALSMVSHAGAVQRLATRTGGSPDSFEALSDFLRTEVHARKCTPRASTLSRVARLLAPAVLIDEDRLEEICDALGREGDLMLAPGGVLYATPTRVVDCQKSARVFSSLPTRVLAAAIARDVFANGATRTVASTDGLSQYVSKISGVMVTPEAWAGLDRTPNADADFLANLDERLRWDPLGARSLEKDSALEWRTWQTTAEGSRWRHGNEGRLWWARTRFGAHHRAWSAGASPSTTAFVELSGDEADRARFALSRGSAGALHLRVERTGIHTTIHVPSWLPRPEYRWLSLHATPAQQSKGTRWDVAADTEAQITNLLGERLGLLVEVA